MAAPNLFTSIKRVAPQENLFDLSHDVKLSANMGELIPILLLPTVPGDKFNITNEAMIRLAPMLFPIMHRVNVQVDYFFVPNRILWPNWENWISNTQIGSPAALPAHPYVTLSDMQYTRLMDYLGLPTPSLTSTYSVSALPLAAYQKIWNEYYRDQNLAAKTDDVLVDGSCMALDIFGLKLRAWEHDYFTSALPFAQKGTAVSIPLGDVYLKDPSNWIGFGTPLFRDSLGGPAGPGTVSITTSPDQIENSGSPGNAMAFDPQATLGVNAGTLNDLRRATRIQEWLELMARGGSRLIEVTEAHFGVKPEDYRLQRPEYIMGTKSPIIISEVLNTTGTVDAPQGQMSGHGIALTDSDDAYYNCKEWGHIIGLMSVTPKTAYFEGIPKHWLKITDPTEIYWPSFANLGEQPIYNCEIYAGDGDSFGTWGYTPRYSEYKFENNRVAGDFKTSLLGWHMARDFGTLPPLNESFIQCEPTHRIFAVEDPEEQKLWCHVFNKVKAMRPMPKFGTPSL